MKCYSCNYFFNEGCCSCITLPDKNLGCVHFVKNHSEYEQQFWKCASCRNPKDSKNSSPVVAVDPNVVTLETVLKEIQGLKSQLSDLPALKSDVNTIKACIHNLENGDCSTEIKNKIDDLDNSVFIAKASVQQLDRKIGIMKQDIDIISENRQKITNETLPQLDRKLSNLDTTICRVEENIRNEMKSIRDEVGLSNVALLGIFSNIEVYQLQEKLNSTQNNVKLFKSQSLLNVKETKEEIASLKAEKESSIYQISKLENHSSWASSETANQKLSYIQNDIQLLKKQVLAKELEKKREITILKSTKELNGAQIADLAKETSEVMRELKFQAESIQSQITLAIAQVSENSQALRKIISELEFKDYAINGKIGWLELNSVTVLETDEMKQTDSFLNEINIVKTHISNTEKKINDFYELGQSKLFSDSRIAKLAKDFLVKHDTSSLQAKSSMIETDIAFFKTFNTSINTQGILSKITELNALKKSCENTIPKLLEKLSQFEKKASSLENDMKMINMKISTSEQEMMKALNDFQTEKESELNNIVNMTKKLEIKQNHQFQIRYDMNHNNNAVGTSQIQDSDYETSSKKIDVCETMKEYDSCHSESEEKTNDVKSENYTDTKDEVIKTETEINDHDSVKERNYDESDER